MPTPRGVFCHPKLNNTHSTIIAQSKEVIQAACRLPEVRKVHPNQIVGTGSRHPRLDIRPIQAGLRLIVRDTDAMQVIHVYTKDPDRTQRVLEKIWKRHYGS